MKKSDKILWEDAIVKTIEKCGGSATLKELYELVPKIRKVSINLDTAHIIRAYLRRMTRVSGKLKRIGLGTYALPEIKLQHTLFEDIQEGKSKEEIFKDVKETDLHSYIEGMLIELGNLYGYLTYTADMSAMFNGKTLNKLATVQQFPHFTAITLLKIARTIDVIWFAKRATVPMPKYTFDVEVTTDFSKALHRAYQLRDFKTIFYVVGPTKKDEQFQKRLSTDPYIEISERLFFRSADEIFSLYKSAITHYELKEKIIVEF